MELNLTFESIAQSLKKFSGVQRRFEIHRNHESLTVVDDYGHHPVEIQATLQTIKEVWPRRRLVVVFQPHRYSRTQTQMENFWSSFNDSDYLIINDIYPAGEEPIEGVHAKDIVNGVKKLGHKNAEHIATPKETLKHLSRILVPGDVLLTLGAGNVWELGQDFLANLPERFREGKSGKDN